MLDATTIKESNIAGRFLILSQDDMGEVYQDNMQGDPMPRNMNEVATALFELHRAGVEKVTVYRMADMADVTAEAAQALAYIWPSDTAVPDLIHDDFYASRIMAVGVV